MVESDDYEITLKEKEWFTLAVDFTRIKAQCHGNLKEVIDDNKKMEDFCTAKHFAHVMGKKDFFDSKNTKELCRSGIPYFYIKDFVLKMFNCQNELEESFKLKFNKVFKDRDRSKLNEYVPYLTGFKTLRESLPTHYLNDNGIQSVKEIQWMLSQVIPTMEFCPLLLKLNSLLHLFCTQSEVYFILRNLVNLNFSLKETYKIRWHMRFNYDDNAKVITSIGDCIVELGGKSGKTILEHLDNIGITSKAVIEDMVFNFFMGYLTVQGVLRLLPFYLREGTKALYRLTYALLTTITPAILEIKSSTEAIDKIKAAAQKITDFKKLFALAYSYNLTRNNNKYDFQPIPEGDEFSGRRSNYYLPGLLAIPKSERILDEESLIRLWSELPFELKIKDIKMIYSSSVDGFSLKTVYSVSDKLINKNLNTFKDYLSLFIIETGNGEKFGGLMSMLISQTGGKAVRPLICYLISFTPNFCIYEPLVTSELILGEEKVFLFGLGEQGSVIRLDDSLSGGFTYKSDSYGNKQLTEDENGAYTIKNIEIYTLI